MLIATSRRRAHRVRTTHSQIYRRHSDLLTMSNSVKVQFHPRITFRFKHTTLHQPSPPFPSPLQPDCSKWRSETAFSARKIRSDPSTDKNRRFITTVSKTFLPEISLHQLHHHRHGVTLTKRKLGAGGGGMGHCTHQFHGPIIRISISPLFNCDEDDWRVLSKVSAAFLEF